MAKNSLVRMRGPKDLTVVSHEGTEYEAVKGFVNVSPAHAEHFEKSPFNFVRVDSVADVEEDNADEDDLTKMSKAELIDIITEADGKADRKMSKEQLIEMATAARAAAKKG